MCIRDSVELVLGDDEARGGGVILLAGVTRGDDAAFERAQFAQCFHRRIGAVHSIVLGGFSPDSLKDRILDATCNLVITSDEGMRGGRKVPMKANIDKALLSTPSVQNTVVVRRTGGNVAWQEGRDVWYHDLMAQASADCPVSYTHLDVYKRQGDGSPIYPGHCRSGVRDPDRPQAMRLRVDDTPITFHDAIQGDYGQNLSGEVGDFVIRRADGCFAYQLAVVIDDADQGITQVVRGGDLLDSTLRQLSLIHI